MNYSEAFLPAELVQALGWTILHSLWQGALVALALSVLLVFLNRHSAQVRYFVSVTALFTTLALAVFTFARLYQPAPDQAKIAAGLAKMVAANVADPVTFSAENPTVLVKERFWVESLPMARFFSNYFEKHLPLLVTFWFLGLLLMALKMLGGLAYVQRLRHYKTRPAALKWQNKLTSLQKRLDLKKPVQLLESLQVKVPMALGFLKPVILVPVGALNGLSEKQVEAILAHELAHIFRHDYVFNLLQTFVETIFFFHPAIWWMSAHVRSERENCCDDIALALCGDSLAFAGALAELEEMKFEAGPKMVLALTGRNGSLLSRIKRLVAQPKRSASFSEGFMAACIVMVSLSVVSLSAMAQLRPDFDEFPAFIVNPILAKTDAPKAAVPAFPQMQQPAANSLDNLSPARLSSGNPEGCEPAAAAPLADLASMGYQLSVSVAPDEDGKDIIIVKDKKGRIVELYVDGKKVRKKDMAEFQRIIDARSEMTARNKKKKKEYASPEDLADARAALRQATRSRGENSRVLIYNTPAPEVRYRYNYSYQPAVPLPPTPPTSWVVPAPPAQPLKPLKPLRPLKPLKPLAPRADDSEKEIKAYEKELQEYEKDLKRYEKEMEEYHDRSSADWKEFERDMSEFGREMEIYGRALGDKINSQVRVYVDGAEGRATAARIREKALAQAAEARAKAAEVRERAAEDRQKAAVERAKAAEIRAKEREKAAEERAKAAKERQERMEKLKAELRKDNLIGADDQNFSYKISNDGLYVNNKKQPQETFEKYRKMFHPGLKEGSNYNEMYLITNDGKSTSIHKNDDSDKNAPEKVKIETEIEEIKIKGDKKETKVKTEKKK